MTYISNKCEQINSWKISGFETWPGQWVSKMQTHIGILNHVGFVINNLWLQYMEETHMDMVKECKTPHRQYPELRIELGTLEQHENNHENSLSHKLGFQHIIQYTGCIRIFVEQIFPNLSYQPWKKDCICFQACTTTEKMMFYDVLLKLVK